MKRVGIVGLGDMGMGMAQNLRKHGFQRTGGDLRESQLAALEEIGGQRATSARQVGENSDVAFVMVLNGDQARQAPLIGGPARARAAGRQMLGQHGGDLLRQRITRRIGLAAADQQEALAIDGPLAIGRVAGGKHEGSRDET